MKKSCEKDFKSICKIIAVIAQVVRVIMIVTGSMVVCSLLMTAFGAPEFVQNGYVTIYLMPISGFESTEALMYAMLSAIVANVTFFVVCSFMRTIFNRLTVSDTPFRDDIADKIKGTAIAVIVGAVVSGLIQIVFGILNETGVIGEIGEGVITFDPSMIFFGVVLYAVSYIFEYGCKLQKQADETL